MAGVFVVIVPTEEFEQKLHEKEEALSIHRGKGIDKAGSEQQLEKNGIKADTSSLSSFRPVLQSQKSESGSVASHRSSSPGVHRSHPDLANGNAGILKPVSKSDSLVKKLEDALVQLKITDAVWHPTKAAKFLQVVFTCESQERCEEILQVMYRNGIGRLYESSLGVIPCSIYYQGKGLGEKDFGKDKDCWSETESEASEDDELQPKDDVKSLRKQFLQSIKARLTVAQVVEGVKAGALITFDYIMFVILASLIAALGLVEDSPVIVVASMLISPIMGPIMAWTFGTVIQDRSLQRIGIKSELIGLALCILSGFIFGLICGPLDKVWGSGQLPTSEMLARGKLRVMWVGMLIALPSGAGVALSILGGNAGSLVGVAISASLLPPCVNAGILWAYALVISVRALIEEDKTILFQDVQLTNRPSLLPALNHEVQYSYNMIYENLLLGVVSLTLCFINIICIIFMALVVLKIKEVAPHTSIPTTARFWRQDIKITRDYNRTFQGHEARHLGRTLMEEWAALNQIDPSCHNPKSASQINYLRNAVEEAEDDEVYRTIIRFVGHPSPVDPVTATLGSLNRITWPNAGSQRGSLRKPKVWDIDFNPKGASMRKRMFSDPGEKYTQLQTISETESESPESENGPSRPRSAPGTGVANTAPPPSSSSHHSTPSRLLRSLIGSKRFTVTRADTIEEGKNNRKSKRVHMSNEAGV